MKALAHRLILLLATLLFALPLRAQITTTTLDVGSGGDLGRFTSQAIVNGNPAISYFDASNYDLKYVRASDASGTTWGAPVTVDGVGIVGEFTSLALVNGNPAISYYDSTNGDLRYVRANDANGTSWGTPVTVDSTGIMGLYTSLRVVNGNPAISYYNYSNGDLKYVRANDTSGTGWGTPVTVDTGGAGIVGLYTSLAVVAGNPTISYHDQTNGDLKYVRAANVNGTSWGMPVTLDSTGVVGLYTSLVVVGGNPAIGYLTGNGFDSDIKYVRATNATGTTWGSPVTVDGTFSLNGPTLAVVAGNPAISYLDATNEDLKYVRATDASGTGWDTPVTVDSSGYVGQFSSLVVVDGNPAISYWDNTNGDLKYVRALEASGTVWGGGTIVDADVPFPVVGQYTSQAIVSGNPAVSYYDAANGALKYMGATDAGGTGWAPPVTVDGIGIYNAGQHTSLAALFGIIPAISYYDADNRDLRYVRANDPNGTSWGTPVVVDGASGINVGQYTSLAVVNGNPAISYYDQTNGNLKYVRASDGGGTVWDPPVTVASSGVVGLYTSLAVIWGNPAISYYDQTNGDLTYVRANDADGTSWGAPVTLDSTGNVGQYTSLAVVDSTPAISYYDATNGDLRYVRANDTDGTNWNPPVTVDSTGSVGQYTSVAVLNGKPVISYYDGTNGDLKAAWAKDTSGTSWSTPLTVDSTGTVGQFTSLALVNGDPAISYFDETNGDLKWAKIALPDIAVEQPAGANLVSGNAIIYIGTTAVGIGSGPTTFTIKNVAADAALLLAVPTVAFGNAGDFSVDATGTLLNIPAGQQTTFAVTFTPTAGGYRSTTLQIASNDADENPFSIVIDGYALDSATDSDGDGLNDAAEFRMASLGFNWLVNQGEPGGLVETLFANANVAGLYTPSQVQALNVGVPLIQRNPTTGVFTLTIGVMKTTNLSLPFTDFPMNAPGTSAVINGAGKLEFQFTVPDNAAFFRLEAQ